jgi:hypothetical protein
MGDLTIACPYIKTTPLSSISKACVYKSDFGVNDKPMFPIESIFVGPRIYVFAWLGLDISPHA